MESYRSISIREISEAMNLTVLNEGNLDLKVSRPNLYQVGYELTGFLATGSEELTDYINVYGQEESYYLEKLSSETKEEILSKYFALPFPALVISSAAIVSEEVLAIAKRYNKNVLRSQYLISETIRELKFYLLRQLWIEEVYEDYALMEIHGIGVLLTGYEDAKIGSMIELVGRGHRLITDRNVLIRRLGENDVEGMNMLEKTTEKDHFFIENHRGRQIDVTSHFGVKSTRKKKKINIVIHLEEWDEKKFYDRLGLDVEYEVFVGEKIQKITLPVRKGRNLAVIIETAALSYRLRRMGLNSAEYFLSESQRIIRENQEKRGLNMGNKTMAMPVRKLKNEFDLKIIYGEELIDTTYVETTNVFRPSLALAGHYELYQNSENRGVQVFSTVEFKFLESLSEEERVENLKRYLSYDFPLIVLTTGLHAPEYFMRLVKESKHILCRSPFRKPSQLIANFNNYLETYFAPTLSLHGVFVELYGFGVLLIGKSGIGKSETALELIHRGHRLVADDFVKFSESPTGDIIGKSARIPYFMEIRGLGIIDIKTLYGLGAVRIAKRLDLIIELKEQDEDSYITSVGGQAEKQEILGKSFKKETIYISSGRNAAVMVEILVMNTMAKILGYNAEKAFDFGMKLLNSED
ncbi:MULTISPECIES: HPr(Ser) kinase/phosphatase [Fusobacterium]|nr:MULTISPECIES: HPr(Ser) kinase/phosphatase [Fusobacterium]KXA14708.1 HPr(Ser) kinase/phosphatase [Fusobacterium equinum]